MSINLALLSLSLVLLFPQISFSQHNQSPCLFDDMVNNRQKVETEILIQDGIRNNIDSRQRRSSEVKMIPVVVHVIHDGGTENISEAQIKSQIQVLNEDFRKMTGTNGDGNGVDTEIQFCLAKKNPEGKCTNGIVRIQSELTVNQSSERALLGQLSKWDPDRYLNIYVVKIIGSGGTGGYAAFPNGPPEVDGVVVIHNAFGTIGTVSGASRRGRTLDHEVGHWLGLFHTFQDGCGIDTCTSGDLVCDTPPQDGPHFNCPFSSNTCSNDFPDEDDQVQNYMDYSPDVCKNMFTLGQKLRMQGTLNNIRINIWSQANITATGCDSSFVPQPCSVVADFTTLTPNICVGNVIQFHDKSLNNPANWIWTFEGGTPQFTNDQNPIIAYDSIGVFPVVLTVLDNNSNDDVTFAGFINVVTPGIGKPLSFGEGFENGIVEQGINIGNPDQGITWGIDSNAAHTGIYSIKINNSININFGQADEIVLPFFDFTTTHPDSGLYLQFFWAYARSDANFSDDLFVSVSTDCGSNFDQIFSVSGNTMTTGPTQTTPFIPDSSQWKEAFIDLSSYRNESYVVVKIVNVTDGGNNLYIDDIYLGDGSQPEFITGIKPQSKTDANQLTVYPNPTYDNVFVSINSEYTESATIFIFDNMGREVAQVNSAQLIRGLNKFPLDVSYLNDGLYFISVQSGKISITKRLMIMSHE